MLNNSRTARGMTPGSSGDPRIVCVFPLLVCPYAKTVPSQIIQEEKLEKQI